MKCMLWIVPAALILFTTACTAALVAPTTAALLYMASDENSSTATVAKNTPSPKATAVIGPAHISGSNHSGQHVSGNSHISGATRSHVSGGGFY